MAGASDTAGQPAQDAAAASASVSLPWWVRYTRWKPTSKAEGIAAEQNLLQATGAPVHMEDTSVGPGKADSMHSIVGGPADVPALVSLAGYGAGAGFYFRNLKAFSGHFRSYVTDLLGTGMSGRPPFKARSREQAEAFFLDALLQWQKAQGLDRVILMGHSLGGYLAATYALQHPERVQHLILVCPAGVAKKPEDYRDPVAARSPWTWQGQLMRLLQAGWNAGFTPGSVIRCMGPFGTRFAEGYVRRRFREGLALSEAECDAFEDYFYHITAAKGSGEHALRYLLAPYAWAHSPLEDQLRELKVPVTFIYGESDWMDPKAGQRICRTIQAERTGNGHQPLSETDLRVAVIPDAGHYPFLDQPELFKQALLEHTRPYRPGADNEPEHTERQVDGVEVAINPTAAPSKPAKRKNFLFSRQNDQPAPPAADAHAKHVHMGNMRKYGLRQEAT